MFDRKGLSSNINKRVVFNMNMANSPAKGNNSSRISEELSNASAPIEKGHLFVGNNGSPSAICVTTHVFIH